MKKAPALQKPDDNKAVPCPAPIAPPMPGISIQLVIERWRIRAVHCKSQRALGSAGRLIVVGVLAAGSRPSTGGTSAGLGRYQAIASSTGCSRPSVNWSR